MTGYERMEAHRRMPSSSGVILLPLDADRRMRATWVQSMHMPCNRIAGGLPR